MIEIFDNIPQNVRDKTKFVFDMALRQKNLLNAVKVLNEYTLTCTNQDEHDYVEFYFNMRLEQMKNGNFSFKW